MGTRAVALHMLQESRTQARQSLVQSSSTPRAFAVVLELGVSRWCPLLCPAHYPVLEVAQVWTIRDPAHHQRRSGSCGRLAAVHGVVAQDGIYGTREHVVEQASLPEYDYHQIGVDSDSDPALRSQPL